MTDFGRVEEIALLTIEIRERDEAAADLWRAGRYADSIAETRAADEARDLLVALNPLSTDPTQGGN